MKKWALAPLAALAASAMTVTLMAPAASAATPSISTAASSTSATTAAAPGTAYSHYRLMDDMVAEATAMGMSESQIRLASELQTHLNYGLRSMSLDLRSRPLSDPEVTAHLTKSLGRARGGVSIAAIPAELSCIYSLADALSIALPGRNIWTLVELATSVPALVPAYGDVVTGQLPPGDAGRQLYDDLSRVVGVAGVVEDCGPLV